jgi:metal-responsive CopG/Arc/MetJ family transcriptional regulator
MKNQQDTEIQDNLLQSCGKQVRITYIPYKYINDKGLYTEAFRITKGAIENICCSYVYIINDHDCFEIFQMKQILEMVEIVE